MGDRGFWDTVYETRETESLGWYQAEAVVSARLIEAWSSASESVLDVGAGASTLVDRLLDDGFDDITLLDISSKALEIARRRLEGRGVAVRFEVADICGWDPSRTYGVWHDRAVFHFLVDEQDRAAYLSRARSALDVGGIAVIGTFALEGPESCSGLPVVRYSPDSLVREFGPSFTLEHFEHGEHRTPSGGVQAYTWVVLRHLGG